MKIIGWLGGVSIAGLCMYPILARQVTWFGAYFALFILVCALVGFANAIALRDDE
jgi:hypothetical protein